MAHTREYKEFLLPELRISRGEIKPRNIYRISTYREGNPATKTGEEARYIFVIGKVGNKIHCLKLNEIKPILFTSFLYKLRDIRKKIGRTNQLSELLKLFASDGNVLFEQHVKNNSNIYGPGKSNYRIYKVDKIQHVWEIRFEEFFLQKLLKLGSTTTTQLPIIKEEISERDNSDGTTIDSPKN